MSARAVATLVCVIVFCSETCLAGHRGTRRIENVEIPVFQRNDVRVAVNHAILNKYQHAQRCPFYNHRSFDAQRAENDEDYANSYYAHGTNALAFYWSALHTHMLLLSLADLEAMNIKVPIGEVTNARLVPGPEDKAGVSVVPLKQRQAVSAYTFDYAKMSSTLRQVGSADFLLLKENVHEVLGVAETVFSRYFDIMSGSEYELYQRLASIPVVFIGRVCADQKYAASSGIVITSPITPRVCALAIDAVLVGESNNGRQGTRHENAKLLKQIYTKQMKAGAAPKGVKFIPFDLTDQISAFSLKRKKA
eukprot:GILK01001899.1.p1 GENE.GILK01001899.1~~GILK01001899.1.p1  ORF type:complete len:319 (-),score=32.11 GILK01001899.1:138-1058(-)